MHTVSTQLAVKHDLISTFTVTHLLCIVPLCNGFWSRSCIEFNEKLMSFDEAKNYCEAKGMELPIINSREQHWKVLKLAKVSLPVIEI